MSGAAAVNPWVKKVHLHKTAFRRTMECFQESDSTWRPVEGALTVADQVLHVINSNEYVLSGLFGPFDGMGPASRWERGFADMSWTNYANSGEFDQYLPTGPELREARGSLSLALSLFDRHMDALAEKLAALTEEELNGSPLENPLFPVEGMTNADLLDSLFDHTAHHRGALSSYARLLGYDPRLPYYDMVESFHEQVVAQVALGTN